MKKSVLIGASRKQKLPALVSEFSIKRRLKDGPVDVLHSWDRPAPECGKIENRSPTGFSFVRFTATDRARESYVAYIDSDMFLRGDINDLFAYMPGGGVPIVCTKPQAAVFVVDTSVFGFDVQDILDMVDDGEWQHRSVMQLDPWAPHRIIPKSWNDLDNCDDKTMLLHYTDMRKQPWVVPDTRPVSKFFISELREAIHLGLIKKETVEEEVDMKNVSGHLLGMI